MIRDSILTESPHHVGSNESILSQVPDLPSAPLPLSHTIRFLSGNIDPHSHLFPLIMQYVRIEGHANGRLWFGLLCSNIIYLQIPWLCRRWRNNRKIAARPMKRTQKETGQHDNRIHRYYTI